MNSQNSTAYIYISQNDKVIETYFEHCPIDPPKGTGSLKMKGNASLWVSSLGRYEDESDRKRLKNRKYALLTAYIEEAGCTIKRVKKDEMMVLKNQMGCVTKPCRLKTIPVGPRDSKHTFLYERSTVEQKQYASEEQMIEHQNIVSLLSRCVRKTKKQKTVRERPHRTSSPSSPSSPKSHTSGNAECEPEWNPQPHVYINEYINPYRMALLALTEEFGEGGDNLVAATYIRNGRRLVPYHSKMNDVHGRIYPKGIKGPVQHMSNLVRGYLFRNVCDDVDGENMAPTVLLQYAKSYHSECKDFITILADYVKNRDKAIALGEKVGLNRATVKLLCPVVLNGGSYDGWIKQSNITKTQASKIDPSFRSFADNLYRLSRQFESVVQEKIHTLYFQEETKILTAALTFAAECGYFVNCPIHDGFHVGVVKDGNLQKIPRPELENFLGDLSDAVFATTSYRINYKIKELPNIYSEDIDTKMFRKLLLAKPVMGADEISLAYAIIGKLELCLGEDVYMKNMSVAYLTDGEVSNQELVIYSPTENRWMSDNDEDFTTKLGNIITTLGFSIKESVYQNVLKQLKRIVEYRPGIYNDSLQHGHKKLFFQDGYYDAEEHKFHPGLNIHLFPFRVVPSKFPTKPQNYRALREKLFFSMFADREVSEFHLKSLARGAMGDNGKYCTWLTGGTGTGKSILANALLHALGDQLVCNINADSLLTSSKGFELDFERRLGFTLHMVGARICFSNEIKMEPGKNASKICATSYKRLINGGTDVITARQSYGRLRKFMIRCHVQFQCNDIPAFTQADDAVRDRTMVIMADKKSTNEEKFDDRYYFKRDNDLDKLIRTDTYKATVLWSLIEAYQDYKQNGFEVPESVQLDTNDQCPEDDEYAWLDDEFDFWTEAHKAQYTQEAVEQRNSSGIAEEWFVSKDLKTLAGKHSMSFVKVKKYLTSKRNCKYSKVRHNGKRSRGILGLKRKIDMDENF